MPDSLNSSNNTALLVIDKQIGYSANNQFLTEATDNKSNPFVALLPLIDEFIKVCRTNGLPIVWTQMIEDSMQSPANIADKMKLTSTPSISKQGAESFGFNGLGPKKNEKVIIKKYFDAFAQTDLDEYLRSLNISTVILIGGYTSRCVLGSAFGANGCGYNVIVVKDLVGNPNRSAHEVPIALEIIDSILGYVVPQHELKTSCKITVPPSSMGTSVPIAVW